jgi:putative oxidoreductase
MHHQLPIGRTNRLRRTRVSSAAHVSAVGNLVAIAQRIVATLERFPLAIVQLLARVSIGAVFWHSGLVKFASWESTLVLFRDEYKVPLLPPEIAAPLAAATELSMPILLLFGLATRLATLPMLGMTAVIEIFVYPEDWVEHLGWFTFLLFILTRGPGPISLDHVARRWLLARR